MHVAHQRPRASFGCRRHCNHRSAAARPTLSRQQVLRFARLTAAVHTIACRLADLLDAPALLSECLATLCCVVPGPETFAPLLALAEGRQYHTGLQRLKVTSRCNGP